MSTTFTRRKYDKDELELNDSSVVASTNYMLNLTASENKNLCYSQDGGRNSVAQINRPRTEEGFLDFSTKADIENKLQNRHVANNPFDRTNKDYAEFNSTPVSSCGSSKENMLNTDTRFTHPVTEYRGMYTANYNFTPYLHVNPQQVILDNDKFLSPNRLGVSSRYLSKQEIYENKKKEEKIDFNEVVSGLLPK